MQVIIILQYILLIENETLFLDEKYSISYLERKVCTYYKYFYLLTRIYNKY